MIRCFIFGHTLGTQWEHERHLLLYLRGECRSCLRIIESPRAHAHLAARHLAEQHASETRERMGRTAAAAIDSTYRVPGRLPRVADEIAERRAGIAGRDAERLERVRQEATR